MKLLTEFAAGSRDEKRCAEPLHIAEIIKRLKTDAYAIGATDVRTKEEEHRYQMSLPLEELKAYYAEQTQLRKEAMARKQARWAAEQAEIERRHREQRAEWKRKNEEMRAEWKRKHEQLNAEWEAYKFERLRHEQAKLALNLKDCFLCDTTYKAEELPSDGICSACSEAIAKESAQRTWYPDMDYEGEGYYEPDFDAEPLTSAELEEEFKAMNLLSTGQIPTDEFNELPF